MIRRYFVAIFCAAAVLAACTQQSPTPVQKPPAQEVAKKPSQKDDIHINHTGW